VTGDLTKAVVEHAIADKKHAYTESSHGDYLGSGGGHGLDKAVVRNDRKGPKNKVRSWVTHHGYFLLMISWEVNDVRQQETPRQQCQRR